MDDVDGNKLARREKKKRSSSSTHTHSRITTVASFAISVNIARDGLATENSNCKILIQLL